MITGGNIRIISPPSFFFLSLSFPRVGSSVSHCLLSHRRPLMRGVFGFGQPLEKKRPFFDFKPSWFPRVSTLFLLFSFSPPFFFYFLLKFLSVFSTPHFIIAHIH